MFNSWLLLVGARFNFAHDRNGSIVKLSDGSIVKTRIIVDCTGHETKFIAKKIEEIGKVEAGYQIAYGMTADVEPIDKNKVKYWN